MNHKQNTASQYDRDLKICEAATEGPWEFLLTDKDSLIPIRRVQDVNTKKAIVLSSASDIDQDYEFIAHFNPTYVTQLIKKARRCEELEKALLTVACELAESDIENDDGLKELHADVLHVLNKDKVQELLK